MEKYRSSIVPLIFLAVVILICVLPVHIALHLPGTGYEGPRNENTYKLLGFFATALIPILFTAWAAVFYISRKDLLVFILFSLSLYIGVAAVMFLALFTLMYTLLYPIIWIIACYIFISITAKYARQPVAINYNFLLAAIIVYFIIAAIAGTVMSMSDARSLGTEPLAPFLKYGLIFWQLFTGVCVELIFGRRKRFLVKTV